MSVQQQSSIDSLMATSVEEVTPDEGELNHGISAIGETDTAKVTMEETSRKFRSQLSPKDLAKVEAGAPAIAQSFAGNYNLIIEFGASVMEKVNDINSKLLEEQKDTDIPEADSIVNGILREIDGYSAKYGSGSTRAKNFFDGILDKFRGGTYQLKAMIRDAKPIADKLDLAQSELLKMELELKDNVTRGIELRRSTLQTISEVVQVLAVFEEVLDVSRKTAWDMQDTMDQAVKTGEDSVVTWEDRKYTIEEFREVLQNQTTTLGEIEKSWFNWRQKFFLYNTNVVASRNIINISIALQRTCHRVYTDAIPAARSQLVVWQQAEKAREGARMANAANDGVDRLIAGAAQGTADAVKEVANTNQRSMLSEETVLSITKGLQDQFTALVKADENGRKMRQRNLDIIRQSEVTIRNASDEAQKALIENAMAVVNSDAKALSGGRDGGSDDVLSTLGLTK